MNVRCKLILFLSVAIFSLLSGCVKDTNEDCECDDSQGLNVFFYSKTICQTDTVYPDGINDITLCLFDRNNLLVDYIQAMNVELTGSYFLALPITSGLYSAVAWSGLTEDSFIIHELQNGITTKNSLLFRLQRNEAIAYSLENTQIYYGESAPIYIEKNNNTESSGIDVGINMQEVTNRITISVEGLETPDDFEIILESNNGSMNIDGVVASDDAIIYEAVYTNSEEVLEAHFTTLKLETGLINTIVIRNRTEDTEVYRGNLLGTLLLKNPSVNLACDHDFTIRFTAEDQCDCGTYMITEIWVNNWLVHSYDTQM